MLHLQIHAYIQSSLIQVASNYVERLLILKVHVFSTFSVGSTTQIILHLLHHVCSPDVLCLVCVVVSPCKSCVSPGVRAMGYVEYSCMKFACIFTLCSAFMSLSARITFYRNLWKVPHNIFLVLFSRFLKKIFLGEWLRLTTVYIGK